MKQTLRPCFWYCKLFLAVGTHTSCTVLDRLWLLLSLLHSCLDCMSVVMCVCVLICYCPCIVYSHHHYCIGAMTPISGRRGPHKMWGGQTPFLTLPFPFWPWRMDPAKWHLVKTDVCGAKPQLPNDPDRYIACHRMHLTTWIEQCCSQGQGLHLRGQGIGPKTKAF